MPSVNLVNTNTATGSTFTTVGTGGGDYSNINEYGPPEEIDYLPFHQCVTSDRFYSGDWLGPQSQECRTYMAEYCARNWTPACETLSMNRDYAIPSEFSVEEGTHPTSCTKLTDGQAHLRRTLERKVCKYTGDNCTYSRQSVNPTIPNSPLITKIAGDCKLRCDMTEPDDKNLDNILDSCLANDFKVCAPVLENLCQYGDASKFSDKLKNICKLSQPNEPRCDSALPPVPVNYQDPMYNQSSGTGYTVQPNLYDTYLREGYEQTDNSSGKDKMNYWMVIILIIMLLIIGSMVYSLWYKS